MSGSGNGVGMECWPRCPVLEQSMTPCVQFLFPLKRLPFALSMLTHSPPSFSCFLQDPPSRRKLGKVGIRCLPPHHRLQSAVPLSGVPAAQGTRGTKPETGVDWPAGPAQPCLSEACVLPPEPTSLLVFHPVLGCSHLPRSNVAVCGSVPTWTGPDGQRKGDVRPEHLLL